MRAAYPLVIPYLLLAFIPYFFLWYYFERVRGKNLSARSFPS